MCHRGINQALDQAISLGMLGRDVALSITPPRVATREQLLQYLSKYWRYCDSCAELDHAHRPPKPRSSRSWARRYFDRQDTQSYGLIDALLRYRSSTGRFERVLPGCKGRQSAVTSMYAYCEV